LTTYDVDLDDDESGNKETRVVDTNLQCPFAGVVKAW
jgi:hypothetical protein